MISAVNLSLNQFKMVNVIFFENLLHIISGPYYSMFIQNLNQLSVTIIFIIFMYFHVIDFTHHISHYFIVNSRTKYF